MRKLKFKNVKELYGDAETEVSSVVKGSLCLEGFSDEADCVAALNMGSFNTEKGFGNAQLLNREPSLKDESGTCNTHASSFSPSVHSKQMETKNNEFLGKACQKKDGNCCSFNDADLSSSRVNSACNDTHCIQALRQDVLSLYARVANKMITETNLRPTCVNNIGPLKASIFHDKFVSNMLERQESECLGDNVSFIFVSDYAKTRGRDHNSDADKKSASYSSTSVDSFFGNGKEVNGKPASCFLVGSPCRDVDDNHLKRSNRSSVISSQELLYCSNKSDFSEISSLRDSCAVANLAKGEHSECSEGQVQSSFPRAGALPIGSQIGDDHTSTESMEVDNGTKERAQTAELKFTTVAMETNIGSRPAACSDASDSIEYEVNVCDICGEIGREALLAVCSNCNDGAEHIYCMRVKMDSVPKGDWMCEECVLSKETERKKQDKLGGGNRTLKKQCTLVSETKPLEVEESKARKVSSTPLFTSKRPSGSLHAVRNKGSGTELKSPATSSSSSKASMHQSGGLSSSTTSKTLRIPTELTSKSPKLSLQYQASKGLLSKSRSFSATSMKEDVQLLKESSFRNEGLAKETDASESVGEVQMMSKSLSLKNMSSYTVNNSNNHIKLPPNYSCVEDLKRSRHPKGQCPAKTEKKLKLSSSDSLAAMADNIIASPGKNSLAYPSGDVKGYEVLDNSSRRSSPTAE